MGEIEYSGQCQIGHNVKIGYFAQNQASLLKSWKTIFQTVDEVAEGEIRNTDQNNSWLFSFQETILIKK